MTAKSEYPKIETLYNRDPANMRHVVMRDLRMDEFGLVDRWHVTEKIHGTNIRVIYQDGLVRFGGRTDQAHMPLYLLDALRPIFPASRFAEVWPNDAERDDGRIVQPSVVLYGEGYGPKIMKGGGNYRADPGFRLFDVAVWGDDGAGGEKWWWLTWDNVVDVAQRMGIETVPVLAFDASTEEALTFVSRDSEVARIEGQVAVAHEGIVCRTEPPLFTRRGKRLMWKLKITDLPTSF